MGHSPRGKRKCMEVYAREIAIEQLTARSREKKIENQTEDMMDRAQDVLVVKTAVKSLGINPRNMLLTGKLKGTPAVSCIIYFCLLEFP